MLRKVKKLTVSATKRGGPAKIFGGDSSQFPPQSVADPPRFLAGTDKKIKAVLLCFLSGLLLALPFCNGKLWIFSWFGFVPAFLVLNNKSLKKSFLLFFVTGTIFWSIVIYWLIHITLPGTIVLILYLALFFALFGLIIRPCTRHSTLYTLIFIPSVWVLLEYARGHLLTGFPWAILGYSQYLNLPVIQIADITGAWGISFLIVMVNVCIVEVIAGKKSKARAFIVFCCLSVLASLVYGNFKINSFLLADYSPLNVSVIQGNIPQEQKWDPAAKMPIIEKYFTLTKQAAKDKASLIVWPEAALPVIPQEDPQIFEEIKYFVKDTGIPLLSGAVTVEDESYYNSALFFSGKGEVLDKYNKIHLVPFGEYIPLRKLLPFLETVVPIGEVEHGKEYTIFKITNHKSQITNFSVLICFEDVFPHLAREFVRKGAGFLVNITNDGWYKKTSAPYQHLQASVFRAVENRVYLVRSANTGVSAFISPLGKISSRVSDASGKEIFVDGYKADVVGVSKGLLSFYTQFGNVFILMCVIIFILGMVFNYR